MIDSIIERAARAMFEEAYSQAPVPPFEYADCDKGRTILDGAYDLRAMSRAVLQAIRDVDVGSPATLVAGKQSLYSCSEDPELNDARQCWQAMIDSILSETP